MKTRKLASAVIYPIPYEDRKAWLAFRKNGIGGSEVSAVMGENDYTSPAEVFHRKIDLLQFPDIDNESMFWGRENEANIAEKWQYWWNGQYIENYKKGEMIRRCMSINGYAVNPDYPWLFASLDRYVPKGTVSLDGEPQPDGFPLEVKTVGANVSNKWKHGIPESYVLQVHVYMIVFGMKYAEIVFLEGGNKLHVLPVHYSEMIGNAILARTYDFWHNRVLPAQELIERYKMTNDKEKAEQLLGEIDRLEPNPDGSKSFRDIMNQRYDPNSKRESFASDEFREAAIRMKVIQGLKKTIEEQEEEVKNLLIQKHIHSGSEVMEFGDDMGYTKLAARKNSNSPTFDNRIKIEVDKDQIKTLITTLGREYKKFLK